MEGNGAGRLKIHFRNSSTFFCCGRSIRLHLLGGLHLQTTDWSFSPSLSELGWELSKNKTKNEKTQSESWTEGVWFPSLGLWVTEWARHTWKYSGGELSLRLSARTVCGPVVWACAVKHIETTYRVWWCVGPPGGSPLGSVQPLQRHQSHRTPPGFSSMTKNTDANTSCTDNQL